VRSVALAILYGVCFCLAAYAANRRDLVQPGPSVRAGIALLFLFGVLISISRGSLETGDIPTYAEGFESDEWDLYYLREAPFWLLGRALTAATGDVRATFFILDTVVVFLLLKAFRGKVTWHSLVFLLAFPTVLGFTNIYRQLLATTVVLSTVRLENVRKKGALLALACLVHIAMIGLCVALALGYALHARKYWLATVATALGVPTVYLLLQETALTELTGGTESRYGTGLAYVVVGLIVLALATRRLWVSESRPVLMGTWIYYAAGAGSLLLAPDSTGTRIVMIALHLAAFLYLSEESLADARPSISAIALTTLLVAPVALSDSAWHLLFGYVLD
jgi:hypothetical protein